MTLLRRRFSALILSTVVSNSRATWRRLLPGESNAVSSATAQKPNASRAIVAVVNVTAKAMASGISAPIAAHFALSVSL